MEQRVIIKFKVVRQDEAEVTKALVIRLYLNVLGQDNAL